MPEKRKNKSKEELLAEMESRTELKRLQNKVLKEYYPLLLKHSTTVENAKIVSQAFSIAIEQKFINLRRTMKVKDLGLREMLAGTEEAAKWQEFFDMFDEETIESCARIVKDMPENIDGFVRMEMKDRPFESLKTYFINPEE